MSIKKVTCRATGFKRMGMNTIWSSLQEVPIAPIYLGEGRNPTKKHLE